MSAQGTRTSFRLGKRVQCPTNKHAATQLPNTPGTGLLAKFFTKLLGLCHHATSPKSPTVGTALTSKTQRDTVFFHKQVQKLKETGSEVNIPITFLSCQQTELAGHGRGNMLRLAEGRQHTPHLCNATAQGKYDSEGCL